MKEVFKKIRTNETWSARNKRQGQIAYTRSLWIGQVLDMLAPMPKRLLTVLHHSFLITALTKMMTTAKK